MRLLFELSREHETLPEAELFSVLKGEGLTAETSYPAPGFVCVDVDAEDFGFVGRLALTKRVSEILSESSRLEDVVGEVFDQVSDFDSFRVTCKDKGVEKKLGGLVHGLGLEVDLKNPDVTLTCDVFNGGYLVGVDVSPERDFDRRRPKFRPFFHPTSMHPKIARALVNLSVVGGGDSVLDPFCGTGGILIEAGLMGFRVLGCDIDARMVSGCRKNLRFFGLSGEIRTGDALSCTLKADAVVTDPPYGRSSFFSGEDSEELFNKFIEKSSSILVPGRRMVLVAPSQYRLGFPGFDVESSFDLRMHKSLTRRIWVLSRK